MYSVVLMAALTSSAATPDWCNFGGFCGGSGFCGRSYGCCGGTNYGCCGGSCWGNGSCSGCYGVYGGACGGSCSGWGCWGSCNGCCGGCWGSCNGCCGGCWGSCCGGCWGSCSGCGGCYGSYGTSITVGAPIMTAPGYTAPTTYMTTPGYQDVAPITTTYPSDLRTGNFAVPVENGNDRQASAAPAKLLVDLPAEAKLYVDGQLTTSTNENRVFTTPALQSGLTYYYDLKAEITRGGSTLTENKRVIVHSGDSIRTTFAVLEAELKRDAITTTASK